MGHGRAWLHLRVAGVRYRLGQQVLQQSAAPPEPAGRLPDRPAGQLARRNAAEEAIGNG